MCVCDRVRTHEHGRAEKNKVPQYAPPKWGAASGAGPSGAGPDARGYPRTGRVRYVICFAVSLSLSVLWDLAAEYRGGRTSTVICFFPFSHCVLGPYGGMWRRRLTPDSLMALPDVGTKVMETKREGSGVFLVTLFSLPVSSNHFRSHCGDTTFPLWCCLLYPDLSLACYPFRRSTAL